MGSTRRSFTDEYKRDAVSLIVDGGHTIGEVAKKLDVCDTSIRKWVNKIQPRGVPAAEKTLTESSGPSWFGSARTTRNCNCSSSLQEIFDLAAC